MHYTGAHIIIKSLLEEEVDTIFGYPGGGNMPIYDALYDYTKQIDHIMSRHEQGSVHAAEGYAKASGKIGVCLATSGPGATNLVTGIANAQLDSTPIVCLTGQVATDLLGTQAFQEVDIIPITKPITKWNYQVKSASEIAPAIAKAFHIAASGRPGPVLIDIPKNIQFAQSEFIYTKLPPMKKPSLDKKKIKDAAALLNTAKRPLILIGQGVTIAHAEETLCKLAGRSGIPVATTLPGLSSFPCHHPLYVGLLGMHGNYAPNKLTNKADVILAVGMRFADRVTGTVATYAKHAKIIHIDISASELNRLVQTDIAINADANDALDELNQHIVRQDHQEWVERFHTLYQQEYKEVIANEIHPQDGDIRMGEFINALSEQTQGQALIVADVGQHQMITARYYTFSHLHSFITSGGLGTMGFSLPSAIGAKKACPQREVMAIMGDGSAQMNIQELGTIMQAKIPIKIIICNNSHLGLVRQWQELFFEKRYSSVALVNPDFRTLANAYGIQAYTISHRETLNDTLKRFLQEKGAALLEVKVQNEEKVFPMVPPGASIEDVRLT